MIKLLELLLVRLVQLVMIAVGLYLVYKAIVITWPLSLFPMVAVVIMALLGWALPRHSVPEQCPDGTAHDWKLINESKREVEWRGRYPDDYDGYAVYETTKYFACSKCPATTRKSERH